MAGMLLFLGAQYQAYGQGIVSDNFDNGSLNPQWQSRNVLQGLGGYVNNSFPTNGSGKAFRLQRGSVNMAPLGQAQAYGTGRAWLFRTNEYTDFYVAMDLVDWNNLTNQALVLLARASGYDDIVAPGFPPGLGTVNGYVCNYDCAQDGTASGDRLGGEFQINRVVGEGPKTIAAAEVSITPGRSYRIVFTGTGTTLTGQLYDFEDLTRPIVTIVADDPSYSTGKSGIVTFHRDDTVHPNQTDLTVDNYYSAPSDPNLDIAPAIRHPIAGTPQVVMRNPTNRFTNFHPASSGISFTARTFSTNQIKASATKLFLNGADVSSFLAPFPANGDSASFSTAAGTLAENKVYTARIELQDTTGALRSTNTFRFDTFSDAYLASAAVKTIEAEDYNYANGQFQLDPIPVSGFDANLVQVNGGGIGYLDLIGTADIDFHDTRTGAEGGWADYRVSDAVGTAQGCKDDIQDLNHPPSDPLTRPYDTQRQKYAKVGLQEYLVAHWEVGEWMNYTRVFANTNYYVLLRCGSFGEATANLDLVSGDLTSTNQTTKPLGTFVIPNHQMRINFAYEPLRIAGIPAVVPLAGTNTLRLTLNGTTPKENRLQYLNYLLFVPTSDVMVEPRLFASRSGGTVAIMWPLIPYRLQRSPSLAPPSWTTVSTDITVSGSHFLYQATSTDGAQFYRLVYP